MNFKPELIEKILTGEKTVTRRKRRNAQSCMYRVGKNYAVQPGRSKPAVARIHVLAVDPVHLKEIDDEDARREGFESRTAFLIYWAALYGGDLQDQPVWRIEFELLPKEATQ